MIELVILLCSITILFWIAYALSKNFFFSPSLIATAIFLVATVLAIRDTISWKVNTNVYTERGTFILVSGMTVFLIVEQCVKVFAIGRNQHVLLDLEDHDYNRVYHPKGFKIILVTVFSLALVIIYCYMMFTVAKKNGYEGAFSLSEIGKYHHAMTFNSEVVFYTPRWVRITRMVVEAIMYVFLYIFIRNIVYGRDRIVRNIIYLFPIISNAPISIINSSRSMYLQLSGYAVFIAYIMLCRRNKWSSSGKSFKKMIVISGFLLIAVLFVFYQIQARGILGRMTNRSLLDHVTMYLGAPIIHFHQFIKEPPKEVDVFGQETFSALGVLFSRLGLRSNSYSSQLEMRSIMGHEGNIYTFFRRPYHDFGLWGMYIVTGVTSAIFSWFCYSRIYRSVGSTRTDWGLIIYGYLFYIVYLVPSLCELCNIVYFGILYFFVTIILVYSFLMRDAKRKRSNLYNK